MADRADENPEDWADRPPRRDGASAPGTSGAPPGTSVSGTSVSGTSAPGTSVAWPALRAWAVVLVLRVLVTYVNVTTILDDARREGQQIPLALPVTLELTSGAASMIAAVLVAFALRIAPPGRGPLWRTLGVHFGGTLAFSGAHVGLMTLMRIGLFATAGHVYRWSPAELPYEYRKDFLTYVVIAGVFWLLSRPSAGAPASYEGRQGVTPGPSTFDIRDGASILRVEVAEILAARGAGNYVEFALQDGRRPLMRVSMGAVEHQLAPAGFVRTHRSWLVNATRVREIAAAGSGDFRLDLGCGLTAPLSRRYPAALARLRGEAPASQSSA